MVLPQFEHVFYPASVSRPGPDRIIAAQIAGAAARHAQSWQLTAAEEAVAVAELTAAAVGRADLLAKQAGIALGLREGRPDAARYRQIADLCIAAGADEALIGPWIGIGRQRAAAAAAVSRTGRPPGGLLRARGYGSVMSRASSARCSADRFRRRRRAEWVTSSP
jgi:hypothetical protein